MAVKFDKILGQLREKDTTSAADSIKGIVDYYADLPTVGSHTGEFWLVRYASGTWIISRKPAGLYYSNGLTWAAAPDIIPFFDDDNFRIYDNVDNTRVLKFESSTIATGTTRTLTAPNASGTIALTSGVEVPLTFSSGLTRTVNDVHNDLMTGIAGGQTIYGGTLTTQALNIRANFADLTTGQVNFLDTLEASSPTVASVAMAGGLGVVKKSFFGDTITGKTSTDASIGAELITVDADRDMSGANNWSGIDWSVGSGIYSHTLAGANAATLAGYSATIGIVYQVVMTIVTGTVGAFTISYGGVSANAIGQAAGTLTAYTVLLTATGTDGLVVTPDATWLGSIDNVSVKAVTQSVSVLNLCNAAGTVTGETRSPNLTSMGMGRNALRSTTTAANNLAIGSGALQNNTTGNGNAAIGTTALRDNTIGISNTAIGYQALLKNVSGEYNVALGSQALGNNITGIRNIGLGQASLYSNISGGSNVAIGLSSLYNNLTGLGNIGIGYTAVFANTIGTYNVGIGFDSLYAQTTGSYNLGLGYRAGRYLANGSTAHTLSNNSLYIGALTKASANDETNQIVIGYNAIGNGSNSVTLGSDAITKTILKGNIGIGVVPTTGALEIQRDYVDTGTKNLLYTTFYSGVGTGTSEPVIRFRQSNGTSASPSATASGRGLGTFYFQGWDGSAFINGAYFAAVVENTVSSTVVPTRLSFATCGATGSATERMRITSDGNIGIGTTAPTTPLHVAGSGSVALIRTEVDSATNASTVENELWSVATGTAPAIKYMRSNGTKALPTALGADFEMGSFRYFGRFNTGTSDMFRGAEFKVIAAEAWSDTNRGIKFIISGTNTATATKTDWLVLVNGNMGMGTTAPTNILSLGGNSARTIWMERHTTANTAGNDLTVQGGGATSGATDKDGGMAVIQPGLSTGTGKGSTRIKRLTRAGATGTTDNTLIDGIVVMAEKSITAEGSVNLFEVALPAGGMCAGSMSFQILATDGTDFQSHACNVNYAAVNKAGVYTSQIVEAPIAGSADANSTGVAITDTWAITSGTNKITISVTIACASIVANDIKLYYTVHNGGRNAITQL